MSRTPLASLTGLLRSLDLLVEVRGPEEIVVSGVSQDSRTVEPGQLFLAWEGVESDAHDFVVDAWKAGAVAAVVERPVPEASLTQLVVRDGRRAGALVADAVAGHPGRRLRMTAVTGTNGKTTTALILRHLLNRREPSAALGTLGVIQPDGTVRPGTEGLTTPGPVQLSGWLRALADEGVRTVTMEASSHALAQHRLDALRFQVGVFTNLGRDHLDYHADVDEYRGAKLRLLELLDRDGPATTVVVNADDPAWAELGGEAIGGARRLSFGIDADADLRAEELRTGERGSSFVLRHGGRGGRGGREGRTARVELPLLGRFNVENALAAAAAALALGHDLDEVAEGLAGAPQVPGRLELVSREPAAILIDFAHTPDALERVLSTLRPLVPGRLIVVFGAGGDRDRTKRRPMAEAVAAVADVVILTSDNPRTEDPERILDDLEEGLGSRERERIADRRTAVARALELAEEGDLVLLAGKGHERYQVVGTEKRPLDEREVVREWLERRGRGAA